MKTGFNKHDNCFLTEDCTHGHAKAVNEFNFSKAWTHVRTEFDRHGNLVDRIHAENIGCEYGEYDK